MLQHSEDGAIAFLHKTSTGKFNSGDGDWLHMDYVTTPLTHHQAYHYIMTVGDGLLREDAVTNWRDHCCYKPDEVIPKELNKPGAFMPSGSVQLKGVRCSTLKCRHPVNEELLPVMLYQDDAFCNGTLAARVNQRLETLYIQFTEEFKTKVAHQQGLI